MHRDFSLSRHKVSHNIEYHIKYLRIFLIICTKSKRKGYNIYNLVFKHCFSNHKNFIEKQENNRTSICLPKYWFHSIPDPWNYFYFPFSEWNNSQCIYFFKSQCNTAFVPFSTSPVRYARKPPNGMPLSTYTTVPLIEILNGLV